MSLPHHQTAIVLRGSSVDIDDEIRTLIYLLNDIPGITTTSSCQGTPGKIEAEGGCYGHVFFRYDGGWEDLCRFCFDWLPWALGSLFDGDQVTIAAHVSPSQNLGWGEIRFRNELIQTLTERLGTVCSEICS